MKAKDSSSSAAAKADLAAPLHQIKRRGRKSKQLDPDEKKKEKNARDRERRAREKEELQRLRAVADKYSKLEPDFKKLQNMNIQLESENEQLKSQAQDMKSTIVELQQSIQKLKDRSITSDEIQNWLQSPIRDEDAANYNELQIPWDETWLQSLTHGEDAANYNFHTSSWPLSTKTPSEVAARSVVLCDTEGPGSSQGDHHKTYTDELVLEFTNKLDAKEKSQVTFSDFKDLMEEAVTIGRDWGTLPPSLDLVNTSIRKKYGEIDAESNLGSWLAMPSHTLFCATIREMIELRLEDIDEKKMLLWRDAINSALSINFKVEFAMDHLKKIARAYFGLKAINDRGRDQELIRSLEVRMSTLQIELRDLENKHAEKVREQTSKVREECLGDAEYFQGKSLSTGLLD